MFRRAIPQIIRQSARQFGTAGRVAVNPGSRLVAGSAVALGAGVTGAVLLNQWTSEKVLAASQPVPQANVYSQGKDHALYLWIHVKPTADAKAIAKTLSGLDATVKKICPDADEDDEIWAGVGFGPEFYGRLGKTAPANYAYPHRSGALGDLPSTGGDVFIHAKSNQVSKLYELAAEIKAQLPSEAVTEFKDIYSFVYKNGRDLSGFIDGTENRADEEGRFQVAVNKNSGGSFCITQKWIHDHGVIRSEKKGTLENWVGRQYDDSVEQRRKSITSHVARMTSGKDFESKKPVEIVRQSMPFGTVGGESGLFFIGFAESPNNFEYMLERMTGQGEDGKHCDDVMRLSRCVQGTYWYFPSKDELSHF